MDGSDLPLLLQYLDSFTTLLFAGFAVWAFYTGKIVPSTSVKEIAELRESFEILAQSYQFMGESFGRLCAAVERLCPDSPVSDMLEQNGARIAGKIACRQDQIEQVMQDARAGI